MNKTEATVNAPVTAAGNSWQLAVIVFLGLVGTYVLVAYVLAPMIWKTYAHLHPALDAAPTITLTGDDHPGDPLNVALIGTKEQLEKILREAKWYPANPLGIR